jgi:thiamine-monophosphate kinase
MTRDDRASGPRRLSDLSESELLAAILPGFPSGPGVEVPPGDDAAVVATSGTVIATTDSMVRGRDWRDDWSTGHDVGVKLVAQNVGDVAAMGGVTTGLLVSLMADPATELAWVEDFARGVADAAGDARAPVLGGDLSSAPEGVVAVSITALGDLEGRAPVLRSGARTGDLVAVCGSLGWSGAGLRTYAGSAAEEDVAGDQTAGDEAAAVETVRAYHLAPRPPWEAGPEAARAGATAMIDLSDGLVRDAERIADASGVTIELSTAVLRDDFLVPPLSLAVGVDEGWVQLLSGGEEHSLLATFPEGAVPGADPDQSGPQDDLQRDHDGLHGAPADEAPSRAAPWVVIGRCVARGGDGPPVTLDGIPPTVHGWDHFRPD